MANTLTLQDGYMYSDASNMLSMTPTRSYAITTTSQIVVNSTQVVGTTHEAIAIGDATDTCYVTLANLHATATIQYGHDAAGSFVPMGQINPGDPPARLGRVHALAALYLKASGASTPVGVVITKIAA